MIQYFFGVYIQSTLGIYPSELRAESQAGVCPPMFTAALFLRAKR